MLIKFVGTHKEHDEIDPEKVALDIRQIKTEADYDWALAEIAPCFTAVPEGGTPEADRFDVLAELIEAYENKYWPIAAPDPVEAI